jgi:Holliday junction resolvase
MQAHSIGSAGRKSEKLLAKKLGRERPASGAVEHIKGDIDAGDVLIEAKSTRGDSISIKHDWLGKISGEALRAGKTPALALSFVREDGRPVPNGEWIAIPLAQWQRMRDGE